MQVYRRILTTLLLVAVPLWLGAQPRQGQARIDSLLAELPRQKEDTLKSKLLHGIAVGYQRVDIAKCLEYGKLEMELTQRLSYRNGMASAHFVIGNAHNLQGNFDEALSHFRTASKLFEEGDNIRGLGSCYTSIGTVYQQQDKYPESLQNYYRALRLKEQAGDRVGQATCHLNIGIVHSLQDNDDQALKSYNAVIALEKEMGVKDLTGNVLSNIAIIYMKRASYDTALRYALDATTIKEQAGDSLAMAGCYNITGSIYNGLGNYKAALAYCLKAVAILQQQDVSPTLANTYGDVAQIYLEQNNYVAAERYLMLELGLAQRTGARAFVRDAYAGLSDMYKKTGRWREAMEHYEKYAMIRDSISNEAAEQKSMQTRLQYEFDKKEALANAGRSKKEALLRARLQQKNIAIACSLFAFAMLAVVAALLVRQGRLRAKQQRVELEQKQLRAQMNPHFIFNCLNSIQHFVVANDLKNANKYLTGFALLMRQTLENSSMATISIRNEIAYLKNYLLLEMMRFEDKFTYEIHCAAGIDTGLMEVPIMIVQPYAENAVKHGLCYLKDRMGVLTISFYLNNGRLYCAIDDNGIGREQSERQKNRTGTRHDSQGIELTRQRLELMSRLNGSDYEIVITDKKGAAGEGIGTTVTIKFPVST